jgi:hypothetical protein
MYIVAITIKRLNGSGLYVMQVVQRKKGGNGEMKQNGRKQETRKRKFYWIGQFEMLNTRQKRQSKEQNKLNREETEREIIAVARN